VAVPPFPLHPQLCPRRAASTEEEAMGVSTSAKGDYSSGEKWDLRLAGRHLSRVTAPAQRMMMVPALHLSFPRQLSVG